MGQEFLTGLVGLIIMVLLIAVRIPIAFAMALVGMAGIYLISGPMILLSQMKSLAFGTFTNYDLSVAPLFILMGHLATRANLSFGLFRAANAWLGHFRGGCHGRDHSVRGFRRHLRFVARNGLNHGKGRAS